MRGLTLVEILVVIGIAIILMGLVIISYRSFQKESDLTNTSQEIMNVLRLSQNKTLASQETSQWGVYFSTSASPQEYILFKALNRFFLLS